MSYPFGDQPNLAKYMTWAEEQGCEVRQGVYGSSSLTQIISPDRRHQVSILGSQHTEKLTPNYINHLDRRLGLQSPFPNWPGPKESDG